MAPPCGGAVLQEWVAVLRVVAPPCGGNVVLQERAAVLRVVAPQCGGCAVLQGEVAVIHRTWRPHVVAVRYCRKGWP